ncbi:MAG: MFS transporter [Pseudomonadota bacterium]
MSAAQWAAVIVTIGLNALDGFDVLSISFAGPGIAADWQLSQSVLGWILAMELLGMAVGSITLGMVGDKLGRRTTMLVCLVLMTIGMFGAGHSAGVNELLAWRLLTGLGIGGMLAVTTAAAAEFSNGRWRSLALALMVIGYPIGGLTGGFIVSNLLVDGVWQDIFIFGAWASAAFIPIVWLLIPESPVFLDRRGGPGALEKINRSLARFGHPAAESLTPAVAGAAKSSLADIFKPGLIRSTVLVTAAYFSLITSFYFLVKWTPKIIVDMGFEPSAAAGVLAWLNVGGATGGAVFGFLATRINLRPLTIAVLFGAAAIIVWYGRGHDNLTALTVALACAGFFTNAAICGMYSLFAKVFPTHVRATGTGFAIGVGRGGAVLAPIIAGYLFQAGFSLQFVAVVMAGASLLGAFFLFFLKERAAA